MKVFDKVKSAFEPARRQSTILHLLLFLEILATLAMASSAWHDNALVSASLDRMRDIDAPRIQITSELRWINEKLTELSTREVRTVEVSGTEIGRDVANLTGMFLADYMQFRYRFGLYLDQLAENYREGGAPEARVAELAEFRRLSEMKMAVEKAAIEDKAPALVTSANYTDLLMRSNDIIGELRESGYDEFRTTLSNHRMVSFKHTVAAVVVVGFTVVMNVTKSILMLLQNRLRNRRSRKKKELARISMFLLPVAFLLNLISATVEGVATYILLKQVMERISTLIDVEIVVFNEAYRTLIFDAVLTGSASKFEMSPNQTNWIDRYNSHLDLLLASLNVVAAMANTRADKFNFASINSQNDILAAFETVALDTASTPRARLDALYGGEYLYSKGIYNFAAAQLVQAQAARIQASLRTQKLSIDYLTYLSVALTASGLILALMTVAWKGAKGDAYVKQTFSSSGRSLRSLPVATAVDGEEGESCATPPPVTKLTRAWTLEGRAMAERCEPASEPLVLESVREKSRSIVSREETGGEARGQ
ncbi:hypothetical protein HDU96_001391 [Phlyctochytrium bullatum]|nr:hypothetical protein HDU96_001391 [Phlyctochytrium bullatum]